MAKAEVEEKLAQALVENEQAVKAVEEEKVNLRAIEESIRSEAFDWAKEGAIADIVKFGMGFRHSALFMIRRKYPNLDLSYVDLTLMEGHEKPDPANGLMPQRGQNVEKVIPDEAVAN